MNYDEEIAKAEQRRKKYFYLSSYGTSFEYSILVRFLKETLANDILAEIEKKEL